jgi:uncharacterized protein YwgA
MAEIGRRELLLMLIGLEGGDTFSGSISGITRLQKFIFLLENEEGIRPTGDGFQFEPYKAGPYSSKLYDDLELLENLGLIRSEATAESTPSEAADINRLNFEDLIGGFEELEGSSRASDSFEEHRFTLTEQGRARAEEFSKKGESEPFVSAIRKIKSKYSHYSLRDLLKYVYTRYPDWTTESEIKDEIFGTRRK